MPVSVDKIVGIICCCGWRERERE